MASIHQDVSTPDSILLANIGQSVVRTAIWLFISAVMYGLLVILYSQAALAYLRRKETNWAQFFMFLTSSITFILATVKAATILAIIKVLVHSTLIDYQDLPVVERLPLKNELEVKPNLLTLWIDFILFIISDCIIVWRLGVFAVMQRRKWLIGLPVLTLLGTTGIFIGSLTITTIVSTNDPSVPPGAGNLAMAGVCLSLATNIVATVTFAYVFWRHRRDMTKGLGKHQPTQAEHVLAILVESGVGYCIAQMIFFIIGLIPNDALDNLGHTQTVVMALFGGLSAIYPTAVIALVNNHQTMSEIYSINVSFRLSTDGTQSALDFSAPDTTTIAGSILGRRGEREAEGV